MSRTIAPEIHSAFPSFLRLCGWSAPLAVLAACATTPVEPAKGGVGGPRGLRASEHREAAAEHERIAAERRTWPATTAMTPGGTEVVAGAWYRTWDAASEHEKFAAAHRSKAAALEAAFAEACGTRPLDQIAVSPLQKNRIGGWNTATGVIVYLGAEAGSADQLLADLRCHRAWMMLAPAAQMDQCPLDLPGLVVDARGDQNGVTLALSVRDSKLIPELQRRVAAQAETHVHPAPPSPPAPRGEGE